MTGGAEWTEGVRKREQTLTATYIIRENAAASSCSPIDKCLVHSHLQTQRKSLNKMWWSGEG